MLKSNVDSTDYLSQTMPAAANFLTPAVIAQMQQDIVAAGGNEVFWLGQCNKNNQVDVITAHAYGNSNQVLVFTQRCQAGDVLIHNHPSGQLTPSEADFAIASHVGSQGCGFYIVDNLVESLYPCVQPWIGKSFQPIPDHWIEDTLGPQGLVKHVFAHYETRQGQVMLAQAIQKTLNQGGLAILEAGTGIGKSFAYLLPAIRLAKDNNQPVVISTATITLQEQLVTKDIPILSKALGYPIAAVVLKGRGNYISKRRAQLHFTNKDTQPHLEPAANADTHTLARWIEQTEIGERQAYPIPIDDEVWEEIVSEADNCLQAKCPTFQTCFYYQSRRRAAQAQLIIVNHALLASDISLRYQLEVPMNQAAVLPPYQHLIIDEAHLFEGHVRQQLGAKTNEHAIRRNIYQLANPRKHRGALQQFYQRWLDRHTLFPKGLHEHTRGVLEKAQEELFELDHQLSRYFAHLQENIALLGNGGIVETPSLSSDYQMIAQTGLAFASNLQRTSENLLLALADIDRQTLPSELAQLWQTVESRAQRMVLHGQIMQAVLTNKSKREVSWLELTGKFKKPALEVTPIDVSHLLKQHVWQKLRSVILTSATLAASHSDPFGYLHHCLGTHTATTTIQIASPFDFANRVLLVGQPTPQQLNTGDEHLYVDAQTLIELLLATQGRSLILCTSYRTTTRIHAWLSAATELKDMTILCQGTAAPQKLINQFRHLSNGILIGTASFWEGIDIAGDALQHVIITKLPFAVPTHPLEKARYRWAEEQGLKPFTALALPEAMMRFRQGFGRLIRAKDDWGVITILDPRVFQKSYGKQFLACLPKTKTALGDLPTLLVAIAQHRAKFAN